MEGEFGTDPARRYIAGLSSGAAMSVAVAVAYSEDIAAVGAVAGIPYGETSNSVSFVCGVAPVTRTPRQAVDAMAAEQADPAERRLVPLMVIQSVNDCTVSIVNGRNLRDSWILHYGADTAPAAEDDCMAHGVSCARTRFADPSGATVVETVFYNGRSGQNTHYWPGDKAGPFANPTGGPSASDLLWTFFADKSLDAAPALELSVTGVEVDGDAATLTGAARSEPPVTALAVRLDGAAPQPDRIVVPDQEGAWSTRFEGLADGFYTPVLIATLDDGRTITRVAARFTIGEAVEIVEEVATWQQHLAANRIGIPPAGCANRTFGVCDRDFTTIFFEHGFNPFPLFRTAKGANWFAVAVNATGG